jgi:Icc-related predicted phosphoesterase
VRRILTDAGLAVLDGDACELRGIGIAGVKGFGGGFGKRALGPWGETIIKQFVREAVDEALKLEAALARLRTTNLVALLHYSPIQQTCEGEPPEIYPFLGSSRLEEPLGRYPVTLVVHGHAHRGQLEGRTASGAPVYNVSMALLTRSFGDRPPFRVFEVPLAERAAEQPAMGPTPMRGRRATDAVAS